MRICVDVPEETNERLMAYIIATYGTRIMNRKSEVMRDALREYLSNRAIDKSSNREISKAPPIGEKKSEKEIAPLIKRTEIAPKADVPDETKKPKGHGGKAPYESQYPEIAARVMELWAGGKRKGGMSRDAVAAKLREEGIAMSAAQVGLDIFEHFNPSEARKSFYFFRSE